MIGVTRELSSPGLQEHISECSTDQLEQFELQSAFSASTYRNAKRRLKNAERCSLLVEASYLAVHALFCGGVPVPDVVKIKYGLSYTAGPAASDFSSDTRDILLYELLTDVLEIVVEQLDFGRASNASRRL